MIPCSKFDSQAPFLLTRLPIQSVPTIYARFGNWFAYICVAGTGLVLVLLRRQKAGAEDVPEVLVV